MTITVLLFPLNSPGHVNSSLGIADRLKHEYNYRTVFLLLGPPIGDSIRRHGHELVILDEAEPYEDYEIESEEEPELIVDEEQMRRLGKTKRAYLGAFKWPHIINRNKSLIRLPPLEAFIESAKTMEKLMIGELTANHQAYARAIQDINPDMIIVDAYYVPPCIINLTNIPWVRLYSANPLSLTISKLPCGAKPPPMLGLRLFDKKERERLRNQEPEKWKAITNEWRRSSNKIETTITNVGKGLNRFMIEQGCKPLEHGKQAPDSPHLNIYMCPEALDYDQDDDLFEYPPRWLRCDSLMRRSANSNCDPELLDWEQRINQASKGKQSVVFFSLGSIASGDIKLMKRFVEMFRGDKDRLYIISKGVNGDRYKLDDENMIGANYLPQSYVLSRADLAIVHGGNNSITECMYHGLPMIVLPIFADQLDNAQRVEDLGYGRRLDVYDCKKDELFDAMKSLLTDTGLITKMGAIGAKMQRTDDVGKVASLLKKLIEEKHLDEGFIDDSRNRSSESIEV